MWLHGIFNPTLFKDQLYFHYPFTCFNPLIVQVGIITTQLRFSSFSPIVSSFIPPWLEKILDIKSIFLHLLRQLWLKICSILYSVPCTLEKNVFCCCWVECSLLCIGIFHVQCFLIFCQDDLSTVENGIFKSPTITVLWSISPLIICYILLMS